MKNTLSTFILTAVIVRAFNPKRSIPLLLCLFTWRAHSQISIENVQEIPRLKKGITYVVMKDTASPTAQAYKSMFRYWTCSKVAFILNKDILQHIAPDASFFTIGGYTNTSTFMSTNSSGVTSKGLSYSNTHLYWELWICRPDELKLWKNLDKKDGKFPYKVRQAIGRIEMFTDFPSMVDPSLIYNADYDGDEHIRNWGLGYLKNYVQVLMALLEKGEERSLYKSSSDPKQLENLKKQTLYIPDYVLIKFSKFSGDESKRHKGEKLLSGYKWPYKLIGNKELNEKIMDESQPVYHLVYIKSSTDKYVSVYNSKTGELIYTTYSPVSYNIKDKDFKKLAKAIDGE